MSNFFDSSKPAKKGAFNEEIRKNYLKEKPSVKEFHGQGSSVAVSPNLYKGLEPFESQDHMRLVEEGPVPGFCSSSYPSSQDPAAGTRFIYRRCISDKINRDEI